MDRQRQRWRGSSVAARRVVPMTSEPEYCFGQRVRVGPRQWRTVVSIPHPHRHGCYVWRSGQVYVLPELVNQREEQRIVHGLPPPEPDGLPRVAGFVIVPAMA